MTGGSGCQQIKVFVFRPGFHRAVTALGFRFPFLSPCVFPFISLFPRSVPFFFSFLCLFHFLCYHPTTCTASVALLFSASPSLPCPSSLLLLRSVCTCSGSDEACLSTVSTAWMRRCVCVFMMMLLSLLMKPGCVSELLVVCRSAWCGWSLLMKLLSQCPCRPLLITWGETTVQLWRERCRDAGNGSMTLRLGLFIAKLFLTIFI